MDYKDIPEITFSERRKLIAKKKKKQLTNMEEAMLKKSFFHSTLITQDKSILSVKEQTKLWEDNSGYPQLTDEEELEFCKTLITKINKERASNYDSWFKMGCGLYNTLNGSKEGLSVFLEFSQLAPDKYDEQACIDLYESFRDPELNYDISKGSLIFWYRQDNNK